MKKARKLPEHEERYVCARDGAFLKVARTLEPDNAMLEADEFGWLPWGVWGEVDEIIAWHLEVEKSSVTVWRDDPSTYWPHEDRVGWLLEAFRVALKQLRITRYFPHKYMSHALAI